MSFRNKQNFSTFGVCFFAWYNPGTTDVINCRGWQWNNVWEIWFTIRSYAELRWIETKSQVNAFVPFQSRMPLIDLYKDVRLRQILCVGFMI